MTTILNVNEEEVIPVWQATWALVRYRSQHFHCQYTVSGLFFGHAYCARFVDAAFL